MNDDHGCTREEEDRADTEALQKLLEEEQQWRVREDWLEYLKEIERE